MEKRVTFEEGFEVVFVDEQQEEEESGFEFVSLETPCPEEQEKFEFVAYPLAPTQERCLTPESPATVALKAKWLGIEEEIADAAGEEEDGEAATDDRQEVPRSLEDEEEEDYEEGTFPKMTLDIAIALDYCGEEELGLEEDEWEGDPYDSYHEEHIIQDVLGYRNDTYETYDFVLGSIKRPSPICSCERFATRNLKPWRKETRKLSSYVCKNL